MSTSVVEVNPVASDLSIICQVSVPPSRPTLLLAWLQSLPCFWLEVAVSVPKRLPI